MQYLELLSPIFMQFILETAPILMYNMDILLKGGPIDVKTQNI